MKIKKNMYELVSAIESGQIENVYPEGHISDEQLCQLLNTDVFLITFQPVFEVDTSDSDVKWRCVEGMEPFNSFSRAVFENRLMYNMDDEMFTIRRDNETSRDITLQDVYHIGLFKNESNAEELKNIFERLHKEGKHIVNEDISTLLRKLHDGLLDKDLSICSLSVVENTQSGFKM